MVSWKKWDKAKGIISSLLDHFESPSYLPELDLNNLERKTGFLVHLAMAYPTVMPFLRDFSLTMNSWCSMQDGQGWKLPCRAYDIYISHSWHSGEGFDPNIEIAKDKDDALLFELSLDCLLSSALFSRSL